VSGEAAPATSAARDSLRVVVVGVWLRFPHGMATTKRVELVCRGLLETGADVRVLCLQAAEIPPVIENRAARGRYRGIPFLYASGTPLRRRSFIARRLVALHGWVTGACCLMALRRRGQIDVIYLSALSERLRPHRLFLLALLRLLGVPVVLEVNERPWSLRADRTASERLVSPLAGMDGVVVISHALADWARVEASRLGRVLQVVELPILVDVDEWASPGTPAPPATTAPGSMAAGPATAAASPAAAQTVLFAGSPIWRDTIGFLLESMRVVWESRLDCGLVITGINPAQPEARWLVDLMESGRLDERVEIAGYVTRTDLRERMARADALLIPLFDDIQSRARFPTKLGEYLASGRPVVTSAVGEVSLYVRDGETAFVAAPGDVVSYAGQVCAALTDRERAERIGRAGRELAGRAFDYRRHGLPLRAALDEVAAAGSRRPGAPAQAEDRGPGPASRQVARSRPVATADAGRRVLMATAALGNGGLERQLTLLAGELGPEWAVRVWAVDDGPFHASLSAAGVGVDVTPRHGRFDPSPAVSLWRLLHAWRPEVVHSWHWLSTVAALPACRVLGIPLVDGSIRTGRPLRDLLQPRTPVLKLADVVVANSAAGLRAWGIESPRGRVIYNGFDPRRLPLCVPHRDPSRHTAVMCGRMHPHKDYAALIAAARSLHAEGAVDRPWRVLLVGDGPDRPRLEEQARDLVTAGVVEFVDAGTEVLPTVSEAGVGVLMTDPAYAEEGCSNAIMEYMACGLPVVCCDSGGNREIVLDGVTGYLVPPGDVDALAGRLSSLGGDDARAAQMGAAGRRRFEELFSVDRMVAEYVAAYDDAITAHRRRRGAGRSSHDPASRSRA
jgi:glycosyltransferase involved in cell wall biosynthesis